MTDTSKGYALIDSTTGAINNDTKCYGGFYAYNKTIAFNIVTPDVYHAFGLRTASDLTSTHLSGWTFDAGRIVDANIIAEANPSGNILGVETSASHGLVNDDIVTLHGMNNAAHNGATKITKVDDTHFTCQNIAYVAGAGESTGSVYAPAYLQAGASAAGTYIATCNIDGTAAQLNKNWKWELNVGIVAQDNVVTERNSTTTLASMSCGGIVVIAVGDRVWLSGKNVSDTSDYTVKNMNIYMHRM